VPGHLADAFIGREQVDDGEVDVVLRLVENARAGGLEASRPESGAVGNSSVVSDSTGILSPSAVNE
jgi:hypothetical protein